MKVIIWSNFLGCLTLFYFIFYLFYFILFYFIYFILFISHVYKLRLMSYFYHDETKQLIISLGGQ